jgi:hypothetical protein
MKKPIFLLILLSTLAPLYAHAEQSPPVTKYPLQSKELTSDYVQALGLAPHQVLHVAQKDTKLMEVHIDECSFCGTLKNAQLRDEFARKTLTWLLNKTDNKSGTVEWYNSAGVKIMTISGTPSDATITTAPPCLLNEKGK